jgi:hypothetical protein
MPPHVVSLAHVEVDPSCYSTWTRRSISTVCLSVCLPVSFLVLVHIKEILTIILVFVVRGHDVSGIRLQRWSWGVRLILAGLTLRRVQPGIRRQRWSWGVWLNLEGLTLRRVLSGYGWNDELGSHGVCGDCPSGECCQGRSCYGGPGVTYVKVEYSMSKGEYSISKGEYSVSKGEYSISKGEYSMSKGEYSISKGEYSISKLSTVCQRVSQS